MNNQTATAFNRKNLICDLIFILIVAAYVICSYKGNLIISGSTSILDSDLQTYAQGLIGTVQPELFVNDPVLASSSIGQGVPNLLSIMGKYLMPDADTFGRSAIGLLRAGVIAIFLYYINWYFFGRWLFRSPCLSAMLALAMGVTVWVGWGTFWGITHSDPVPRSLFAAFFPILLALAIFSISRTVFRPLTMFLTGICIWIHGISALNCGAMFFAAFFFFKGSQISIRKHAINLIFCLLCFFTPILIFLWPNLTTSSYLPSGINGEFIRTFIDYRWHDDYYNFAQKLITFLNPLSFPALLIIIGLFAWFFCLYKAKGEELILVKICPAFLLGLIAVGFFCWAETTWAISRDRIPQGHELIRGLRFLVPLSWIMIAQALGVLLGKWPLRFCLLFITCAILLFTTDRQFMAAQYYISEKSGINLPLTDVAIKQKNRAEQIRQLMCKINKIVPPNELIFTIDNNMGVRYLALRPVVHLFKDGPMFFYDKDIDKLKKWVDYEKILHQGEQGLYDAWKISGAPWLLIKKEDESHLIKKNGVIILDQDNWILLHSKNMIKDLSANRFPYIYIYIYIIILLSFLDTLASNRHYSFPALIFLKKDSQDQTCDLFSHDKTDPDLSLRI